MSQQFALKVNPGVSEDIQRFLYYFYEETKEIKLGQRFLESIETVYNDLPRRALQYQIRYGNVRLVRISPFSIYAHYRIDEEKGLVIVEAIFHASEDPNKWI